MSLRKPQRRKIHGAAGLEWLYTWFVCGATATAIQGGMASQTLAQSLGEIGQPYPVLPYTPLPLPYPVRAAALCDTRQPELNLRIQVRLKHALEALHEQARDFSPRDSDCSNCGLVAGRTWPEGAQNAIFLTNSHV